MVSWGEFRGALLALGALLVLILAIVVVQPGLPGELLLQSLRFHLVAGGIGVALVLLLVGVRWRGLLLLLVMVAAGAHGALYFLEFQARRTEHTAPPLARFSVLSFNVLFENPRAEEVVETILTERPDVVLIMETTGIAAHLDRLSEAYPYRVGCDDGEYCDISLLSRLPVENNQVRLLPPFGRQRIVTAGISVDGQAVTIAGVHLSKPYFDMAQWFEVAAISRVLNAIEGPVVLAGDFNAAPWTAPLRQLGQQQQLASGPWPPATWPVRLGPLGVPIDNMFTRGGAQLLSLRAGDNIGSNHRPLWAEIGLYAAE